MKINEALIQAATDAINRKSVHPRFNYSEKTQCFRASAKGQFFIEDLYFIVEHTLEETFAKITHDQKQKEIAERIDLSVVSSQELTPLMQAVVNRDKRGVKLLLRTGINYKERHGWTPIHLAALHGHLEILIVLIKAGADVNASSNIGLTPLMNAAIDFNNNVILDKLIEKNANIHAQTKNEDTALMFAAFNSNLIGVQNLLAAGSVKKIRNTEGLNAKDLAEISLERIILAQPKNRKVVPFIEQTEIDRLKRICALLK